MEFKEYLEFSQLIEDLDFINEGIGSTIMGMVDAGISGTGTAGKQILRGTGNTIRGLGGVATHALGSIFGDEQSREDAKKKLGSSFNRTFRGIGQLATSPYASMRRGFEAGRSPFSKMKPDDGSGWGEMMGIRRKPEVEQEIEKTKDLPSFEDLVSDLYKTRDHHEKSRILGQMKKLYRKEYEEFRIKVQKDKLEKHKKTLGFKKGDIITQETVNKRYLELAKRHHPDKGGNPDDFKEIKKAHDYIQDQILRKQEERKNAI